ncbi:aminotransferase class I/II-fold pyridoxal phosphate-dependent enzyme [Mesorhizobium huakuii]|uniref:Aminotransferase n=1 Tax=Mesorhizobium huakuii TaxID=28104 RepID=A0A7G6T577_9HYPH|nr:aminotransferase class I/II-fold pyridoxal phosphate-dependent enzyme [Mesorhizobium huakuii]QND61909.1 histidinol-phosphate aminotransferase family protein [Mesorhizobium huakuii]
MEFPRQSQAAECDIWRFPLPEVGDLARHNRLPANHGINLRSCELHHPRMTELLREVAPDTAHTQFYPFASLAIGGIGRRLGVPSERLTLAAGSDALIAAIVDAFGSATGRMILQVPNYFGWAHYAALRKLDVTHASIRVPDAMAMGFQALLDTLRSKPPSLVVISNPNSPTGHLMSGSELIELAESCGRHHHLLVVDECFAAFAETDHVELLGSYDHVFLVRSFSKSLGLAGARIAVGMSPPRLARLLGAYRMDGAVSGASLHMLEALLGRPEELKSIWKDIILAREKFGAALALQRPGWRVLPSAGNYVNVAVRGYEPAEVVKHLDTRGVYIRDTSREVGLAGCVRFGIAHWPLMQGVLDAIAAVPPPAAQTSD